MVPARAGDQASTAVGRERFLGWKRRVRGLLEVAPESTWVVALTTLLLHAFLWPRLMAVTDLGHLSYFAPVLVVQMAVDGRIQLLLGLHLLWVVLGGWRIGWTAIDERRRTRLFITLLAGLFALFVATFGYNFYYGHGYLLDRLLLLAAVILVWRHPAWLQPFLVLMLSMMQQTSSPLPEPGWLWVDKRLPLDCLVLFSCFLYVRLVTRPKRHVFLLLALCLTGGVYSYAALCKMRLGPHFWSWIVDDRLSNLMVSAYSSSGWLRFLGDEGVVRLAHWMHRIDPLLATTTILIEIAGFLLVLRPRWTRSILVGFVLLHTAILVTSGIFFWKWIVFDLALLWLFDRLRADSLVDEPEAAAGGGGRRGLDRLLYGPSSMVAAVLIVSAAPLFFYNVPFAWMDTPLLSVVRLYAVGESGTAYPIDGRFFAPYDIMFTQSRFFYVVDYPVMGETYGTHHEYEPAMRLQAAAPEDLPALRAELGHRRLNPGMRRIFFDFVGRWVRTAEGRRGRGTFLHWFAPPFHFRRSPPPDAFDLQEPVRAVQVIYEESFYDGERIVPVTRIPVLSVPVQP